MKRTLVRATLLVVACASLTGCNTVGGRIAGGLLASAAASLVSATVGAIARGASGASGADSVQPAPPPEERPRTYPDEEDPAMLTCEAKHREFLSVYGPTRRPPPQLQCTADGAFGAPEVYGARSSRVADAVSSIDPR